jgi:hypothetical protein
MEYGVWNMGEKMKYPAPDRLDTKTQIKALYYKLACSG